MILAELEVHHSRPIAPTRRVALGRAELPVDPPPGYGGILLGGIVARFVPDIEPDLVPDLVRLTHQLEQGQRIPQPRLRHRLQEDRVGLQRSVHRLVGEGDDLAFELDDAHGHPAQQVLGAVYAAGRLAPRQRRAVLATVRRAVGWSGPIGPELIASLAGVGPGRVLSARALEDPVSWALDVLGFVNGHRRGRDGTGPTRGDIQKQFRVALRDAHPDHGAEAEGAAQRIAELTEARRILLG